MYHLHFALASLAASSLSRSYKNSVCAAAGQGHRLSANVIKETAPPTDSQQMPEMGSERLCGLREILRARVGFALGKERRRYIRKHFRGVIVGNFGGLVFSWLSRLILNMPIWHIPILNMAHPDMEDAHVAPFNRPDGGFPDQTS